MQDGTIGIGHAIPPGPAAARLPDLERALVNPAAVFDTPAALRDHPGCSRAASGRSCGAGPGTST